jgi:alkylmercury lyase
MTTRTDRVDAARLAWVALKLTRAGRHPVSLERLAATVGLARAEVRRLIGLLGFGVRGELVSAGPAPRGTHQPLQDCEGTLGAGPDGSVDMFLLAIATRERVHAVSSCPVTKRRIRIDLGPDAVLHVDPPTAVVAAVDLEFDLDGAEALACAGQPFFASPVAALGWLDEHPGGRIYAVAEYLAQAHRLVRALEAPPRYAL